MIPKGGIKFRGVGPVELLWKTVAVILNFCLGVFITLHDVLHELWDGHRTGNASPEAKLLQQITAMS